MEEIYIAKITNGIRALKLKSKTPKELGLSETFEKLKLLNEGMAVDLMDKYKKALIEYKK